MANSKKDLKAFVRIDGTGRVVAGTLVLRRTKPKVGKWKEISAWECCAPGNCVNLTLIVATTSTMTIGCQSTSLSQIAGTNMTGSINWGDGNVTNINDIGEASFSHEYAPGTYNLSVCINNPEAFYLLEVISVGESSVFHGLDGFNGVQRLQLNGSGTSSADLKGLTSLGYLYLNGISTITNLSDCVNLNVFYLDGCSITSIDFTGLSKLTNFSSGYSINITSLDFSPCPILNGIDINNTPLTSVNISNCLYLNELFIIDGPLTTIDVSANLYLRFINLQNNLLTQTAVDDILVALDNNGLSNGDVQLDGTGNAAPSAIGTAAAANLTGKGWIVITN